MKKQEHILAELKSLNSSLSVENHQDTYSVPSGYFDGFAASVLAKIKAENQSADEIPPLLAGIPRKMPFSVPEGYFGENLETLPSIIREEESPVLAAIGKAVPYELPQGYFEEFSETLNKRISKPQAKVIPLQARKWARMAVAAAITGIIAFSGYNYLNDDSETAATVAYKADSVNKQTAALQKEATVVADLKKVSEKELDAFIQNVEIPRKTTINNADAESKSDLEETLKHVSDVELESFLEEMPTADEELAVID
jgi:hypothetical protein